MFPSMFHWRMLAVLIFGVSTFANSVSAEEAGRPPRSPGSLVSGIDTQYFSESIQPGDDFYLHVNEGWLNTTEIPADRSNYGAFTALEDDTQDAIRALIDEAAAADAEKGTDTQKVGDFYRSLTDLKTRDALGIAPLEPLLSKVRQVQAKDQLAEVMASLQRFGVGTLFSHYVSPNARLSQQYAVYITQSGLTMPDRDYYLVDEPRYLELRKQFAQYVADMMKAIDHEAPQEAAERVLDLETRLAQLQWTKVENRDPVKTYNKIGSEELAQQLSHFDWDQFVITAQIDSQKQFVIRQPSFFTGVNQLIAEVPLETWKEYLLFHVVDDYASALTQDIEKRHFDFHATALSGVSEQKPLWRRGVEGVNSVLGEIVGRLYVEKHFPPAAKERMQELVENLKAAFAERIDALDWMGDETKQQARLKLSKFVTKIGYPDEWKDYSKLEIKPDDLVGNYLRASEVEHLRDIEKLGGPVDRNEWHMTPQTVNAYYNPLGNEIVFPAAILQPPFFNMAADDAVNYGGIGAVIGHELSHGFDDKGSQYDGDGNLRDWWTEKDRKEFDRRSAQLISQYAAYQPFEDMKVNGELTLGENIGDLGGLNVAYAAYRRSLSGQPAAEIDGMTGEQRFFYGWSQVWRRKYRDPELRRRLVTDPHSPSHYRVIGIVSNMDSFYEAFPLKPDDKMWIAPENRVKIW